MKNLIAEGFNGSAWRDRGAPGRQASTFSKWVSGADLPGPPPSSSTWHVKKDKKSKRAEKADPKKESKKTTRTPKRPSFPGPPVSRILSEQSSQGGECWRRLRCHQEEQREKKKRATKIKTQVLPPSDPS